MLDSLRRDLKTLVNINSHSMNPTGVRAVGHYLKPRFEAIGFQTEWHSNTDPQFGDHMFATHAGEGPHILLLGHLDTVYSPDSPFQQYHDTNDKAMGPGVYDMKGGLLVILYALEALHASGELQNKHITVALLGDEEHTSQPWEISRAHLLTVAQTADVALGFEFARALNVAVIERRGTTNWTLDVRAKGGHSSRVTHADFGAGAIYHTMRILQLMREEMVKHSGLTLNPGLIAGGSHLKITEAGIEAIGAQNVIASHALVHGDVRYTHRTQLDAAETALQKLLHDKADPHMEAVLTFSPPKPAMERKPGNEQLLEMFSKISVELGGEPVHAVDRMIAGASDMNMVSPYVPACLDSLGIFGGGAHTDQEWASLKDFPFVMERVKRLIDALVHRYHT